MRFSILGIFVVFIFLGCQEKSIEPVCHIASVENPLELNFKNVRGQKFLFSPFEKDKVFIHTKESGSSFYEYNLTDQTMQSIYRKDWKFRNPSNAPIYVDPTDSIIWIGGNFDLKMVSMKTNKVTTLPIKYAKRIIPFQSSIYIVADHGFYKWDKESEAYEKIKLPFRNFPKTQLQDDHILVFGNNLTYDLAKDTLEKGVHIYDFTYSEKAKNFKLGKGIAVFPHGKTKVNLILPNESRIVGLGNKPNLLRIQPPFIWKNGHKSIIRYDIEKNELDTFRFALPLALGRKSDFRYINRDLTTWIFRKNQLFFLNTLTEEKFQYELGKDEKFISMRVDDCNAYLLFEDKFMVKNMDTFRQEFIPYDDKQYLAQLKEFRDFRNATEITKDTSEVEVLKKLGIIKSRYGKVDHPDIQRELKDLNISAFNSVRYETVGELEICIKNKNIPLAKRKRCYQNVISIEVRNTNFEKAVRLEEEFFSAADSENFSPGFQYYTGLDSIKKYLSVIDSLEKLNLAEDSLAFKKTMALHTVCLTPYFCHEGCGGCDFSLVENGLHKFLDSFPNSLLRDNANYKMLGYRYLYYEDAMDSNFIKSYDNFVKEHPNSDLIETAQIEIIRFIRSYPEEEKPPIRTDYLNRLLAFKKDFPESKHSQWINDQLEYLDKS